MVCLLLFYFWKVSRGKNRLDIEDGGDHAKEGEPSSICVWEGWGQRPPASGGGGLVAKSCLTLCSPMNHTLPGSSVHGILQARIPEWVAISFPRGSSQLRDQTQVSCIAGRLLTN